MEKHNYFNLGTKIVNNYHKIWKVISRGEEIGKIFTKYLFSFTSEVID